VGGRELTRHQADEGVLPLLEAARRVGERAAELRRRLSSAQVVRLGPFEAELRTTDLVALRRVAGADVEAVPRWRAVAEAARRELRRAAGRGDRRAIAALRDLGETPPVRSRAASQVPRHWADTERDDEGEEVR
jgi:hypothetical protein